jgi:hypothetical protein
MNGIKKLGIFIALIGLISGCRSPDVLVSDSNGNPIEGAFVTGFSPSMTGKWSVTNRKGFAPILWSPQETEWIIVEKPGFETTNQIDVRDKPRPIKVFLEKEN